jgi:CRISPR-associated protein (TIGR03986 family)
MEKAKLIISQGKKKSFNAQLCVYTSKGEKTMPFPKFKPTDLSLNGVEVQVERNHGQPVKMIHDGKTLFDETESSTGNIQSSKGNYKNNNRQATIINDPATAPYNFIPLNDKVAICEHNTPTPDFNSYHDNRCSGYIDLSILTKTPLYIRDTMTEDDMFNERTLMKSNMKPNSKSDNDKKIKQKFINSDFFSPGGNIRIPGSSLRGMLHTLVEITGYSKMAFFEKNRKYHFRSFADKSLDLRDEYTNKLIDNNEPGNYSKNLKAGYLIKEGLDFKIKPAQELENRQFFRVNEDLVCSAGILKEKMSIKKGEKKYDDNKKYKMGFEKIRFKINVSGQRDKIIEIFTRDKSVKDSYEGTLVHSGWMRGNQKQPRGKSNHWVIGPPGQKKLDFREGVIEDYKNDVGRHEQADLLSYIVNDKTKEVPCFYVEENDKVISFGHTGFFRLAYKKKLSDLVPAEINRQETVDMAEVIFGNETTFPGRVFFEDAQLEPTHSGSPFLDETIVNVLGKPNPTTFQHYLAQNPRIIRQEKNNVLSINNYNSPNARLSGFKLYWHKSNNPKNWEEMEIRISENEFSQLLKKKGIHRDDFSDCIVTEKHKVIIDLNRIRPDLKQVICEAVGLYETQHTKLKPVKVGEMFKGKIRFENLTPVELGALLFSLSLPEECCHKLGMGKPLGLGSIKVTPTLHLSQRHPENPRRYTDLFSEWETETPKTNDFTKYIKAFEKHILNQVGKPGETQLWDTERLNDLKTMLTFETGIMPEENQTRYMELSEFKKRRILPRPAEVVKRNMR